MAFDFNAQQASGALGSMGSGGGAGGGSSAPAPNPVAAFLTMFGINPASGPQGSHVFGIGDTNGLVQSTKGLIPGSTSKFFEAWKNNLYVPGATGLIGPAHEIGSEGIHSGLSISGGGEHELDF